MIAEFSVENYRSFRDKQTLSFVAAVRDKSLPGNLIQAGRVHLVKVASVHGPNASGKSNLFRAITAMKEFVVGSATDSSSGDQIGWVTPFRLDTESRVRPTRFYVTLIVDETLYEYSFSVNHDRIHGEWLHVTPPPPRRRRLWFSREFNSQGGTYDWKFGEPLSEHEDLLKNRTRDNVLVLSRAADLNVESVNPVFGWFRRGFWHFDMSLNRISLIFGASKRLFRDNELKERVRKLVLDADLDICDLAIEPQKITQEARDAALKLFAPEVTASVLGTDDNPSYSVFTSHHCQGAETDERFELLRDESNGTQKFFALSGPFADALRTGAFIAVDELESSMHPLLTRKLLQLFQNPAAGTKGAQLMFTTHDATLLDTELFRRDQIWLAEKDSSRSTTLSSLYEFDSSKRPRNTEALLRNYLAGRYGAVPTLGPTFEDLPVIAGHASEKDDE